MEEKDARLLSAGLQTVFLIIMSIMVSIPTECTNLITLQDNYTMGRYVEINDTLFTLQPVLKIKKKTAWINDNQTKARN